MIEMDLIINGLIYIYLFLIGAVIASFLCALAYRMEMMKSWREILTSRSICETCGKTLKWYELFPVVSWIVLKGKCSKCKKKISPIYPLFELFLGANFVLFYIVGLPWQLFVATVMMAFLAIYDLQKMEIPSGVFTVFFVIALPIYFYTAIIGTITILPVFEALGISLIITLLNLVKKSFGTADILAIMLLSLFVSDWQILKLSYAAVVIGAIVGVIFITVMKKTTKTFIPFLPFIYAGFIFTVSFLL